MDGFFEILMMLIMIWVFSLGARGKKKRQPRPPGGEAEASNGREAVDWDEAIGDVLEGLGLPRPDQGEEKQKSVPERRPGQPRPRPERAPSRSTAEARGRADLAARRRAELEAQREAELARSLEVQQAEARRRTEVQRRRHRTRSSDLAEIAGLAEAAARSRASSPLPPASEGESRRAPRRPRTPTQGAEEPGLSGAAEVPPSRTGGLKKLEGLSELERAIIYAEILGPPRALQADDEARL
jgi:hypothetical protein